ncbi:MAG: hypothetical protein RL274_502 [Pseudomonadota bacterium]|jgi:SAM-dependent methyltransferase
MKKRLSHISDADFSRFLHFAAMRPDLVTHDHLLQKLTIFNFVAPIVERYAPKTILEIGCGLGFHSALLTNYGHVTATELQVPGSFVARDADVANARTIVFEKLAKREVPFLVNDGQKLPFADQSFDLIFHNSVIEHVPDAVDFNRETARILKPNGIVICITGTPALCRFRLVRDYVLKLPLILATSIVREAVTGSRRRVSDRLRALVPQGAQGPLHAPAVPGWYARLKHYVYSPAYNFLVLDELAKSAGIGKDAALVAAYEHFRGSVWNRLRYYFTPQTHGQHYRDVWHEMAEWKLDRWRTSFTSADFDVLEIIPFRFHQILEATWSDKINAALYHLAAPLIERLQFRVPPRFASEFILTARKK